MQFSNRWGLAVASVLLFCSFANAQDESAQVTVLVNNTAAVEASVLRQAEGEASRLFEAAGIEIQWVDCAETDECRRPPASNEFVLHIVPLGNIRSDSVFGVAFLGGDGRGRYCDVFFDRIQGIAGGIDTGRLLGAVSAHELGHLFLGSNAHSRIGVMEPIWQKDSLRKIGMGALLFTPEQASLMKHRIGAESVRANMLRTQYR